jgi:hypothetical protein
MGVGAEVCVGVGALALVGLLVVTVVVQRFRAARLAEDVEHDTAVYVRVGPNDGELIRVEGRVVVDAPVRAPSGCECALYELYAGEHGRPARALRQRGVSFFVDDGVFPVRIDPAFKLVAFGLPTAVVDGPAAAERVLIERRLQPGARVEVVGRVWVKGAPGHEELTLLPPDGRQCVALTFLGS